MLTTANGLTITKEYLIHHTDETALPVGLVYNAQDIMQLFNVSQTQAYRLLKKIKQGQVFTVQGIMFDSIEIKGA